MQNERISNVSTLMNKLGIDNINNITEEQVSQFVGMMPIVDKDVAIEFIKMLPSTIQATTQITEQLRLLANEGIASSNLSTKDAMHGYQTIIDSMCEAEKNGEISLEEQQEIWDRMEAVADKMNKKDTENKEFVSGTLKTVCTTLVSGLLIIGAFIFGAKYISGDSE